MSTENFKEQLVVICRHAALFTHFDITGPTRERKVLNLFLRIKEITFVLMFALLKILTKSEHYPLRYKSIQ